jgi:hydrogenase maturation protease
MSTLSPQFSLVVGVGNADRGDDGAGIVAARRVRDKRLPGVEVVERSGEASDLLDVWQNPAVHTVYLIDAMASGAPTGSVRCFNAHEGSLPSDLTEHSTHAFGVAHAIELARVLGCLPPKLIVYAIESAGFQLGAALSVEVEGATRQVADRIAASVRAVWVSKAAGALK